MFTSSVLRAEYFSLVYVRSVKAIQLFPRLTLALFLVFNFYVLIYPTGFHMLALFVFFLAELTLMVITVTEWEIPACQRGEITLDQPRCASLMNSFPS
jgi:hypothetical protein